MLLKARPLYDNLADSQLFVTPPQWNPILRAIERRLNVLISGRRGSGKTSLLRQIQLALRNQEEAEAVAFVDGTGAADVLELAIRVREAVAGEPAPVRSGAGVSIAGLGSAEAEVGGASRQLAAQLTALGECEPTVILLDASAVPEAVFGLFGRMRDTLWQQEHRWVLAIDDKDRSTVLRPPADAFFDLTVSLDDWKTNALAELLMRRTDDTDLLAPDLVRMAAVGANGNPREALRALSYGLVNETDPSALLSERALLLERANDLGRAPAMLMAELLDRGRATPSDEELQQSLGVTRTRLTQMFHQLLGAELVTAESERADGPGRPRIVYRPAASE